MYCLFDKVTARYILQGLRKLSDRDAPTPDEDLALEFFFQSLQVHQLFIVPAAL